ncbi:MAG: glutathione S-transferase family protein [Massilia sp.]
MKLYDTPGFPNPARIRIVLAEKGLESLFEFVPVNLMTAEHKQPAFLAKNASGVVPVLELDDGTLIAECVAITEYLDNLGGTPTLTGVTALEKAKIHMMQKRADDLMIDGIGQYFHYATPGLGAALQPYKRPDWAARTEFGEHQLEKFKSGMRYFDGVLASSPYLAGEQFSMADITVYCALLHAAFVNITVGDDLPALKAWQARVAQRPGVAQRSGQQ